jgi:hypothetical protein
MYLLAPIDRTKQKGGISISIQDDVLCVSITGNAPEFLSFSNAIVPLNKWSLVSVSYRYYLYPPHPHTLGNVRDIEFTFAIFCPLVFFVVLELQLSMSI